MRDFLLFETDYRDLCVPRVVQLRDYFFFRMLPYWECDRKLILLGDFVFVIHPKDCDRMFIWTVVLGFGET